MPNSISTTARSREKGEEQVRKIIEAGITTFVCLQVGNALRVLKPCTPPEMGLAYKLSPCAQFVYPSYLDRQSRPKGHVSLHMVSKDSIVLVRA